ncbi:MAG: CPBP family intramembrane glutamic endopeptidase [Candidatus Limnocylindrales bacterium]
MTGPDRPADAAGSIPPPDGDPGPPADAADPSSARPGLRTFTVEGRAAPGLFVLGWLAFIMGGALLFVAFLAGVGRTAALVLAVVGLALLSLGLVAGAGSQAIERRKRATTSSYPGPSPFLVFAASVPVSILAVTIVAAPLVALGLDTESPAATLISVAIQALVYIGLIRLLVVGTGALGWRDMGIGGRPTVDLVRDVAWGVVLALPVIAITSIVAGLLALVLPLPDSPLPPSGGGGGLAFNFVAAAVMAPIGEETFFRGFTTTAWSRTMSLRAAVLRAAIFFAAVHVLTVGGADFADAAGRALFAFTTRLPVAIALGWLFVERRSLAAPIALHATFNGLLVLIAGSVSAG